MCCTRGPGLLAQVLSTVASPVPLRVVIIYREYDFDGLQPAWYGQSWDLRPGRLPPWLWHDILMDDVLSHCLRLRVFHEVHEIRNFQLELCADVWGCVAEYAVQVLRGAVAAVRTRREFDERYPEPLVSCRPRIFHHEYLSEYCTASSPQPWIPL